MKYALKALRNTVMLNEQALGGGGGKEGKASLAKIKPSHVPET